MGHVLVEQTQPLSLESLPPLAASFWRKLLLPEQLMESFQDLGPTVVVINAVILFWRVIRPGCRLALRVVRVWL